MTLSIESSEYILRFCFLELGIEHLIVDGRIDGSGALIAFQKLQTFKPDSVLISVCINLIDLRPHLHSPHRQAICFILGGRFKLGELFGSPFGDVLVTNHTEEFRTVEVRILAVLEEPAEHLTA